MIKKEGIVYVVDDDAGVRASITALLKSRAIRSAGFADVPAFLNACPPDVGGCLILDVRMPGPSGLDLQRYLGERGYTLPVVIITGHAEVPMAVRALKAGALDFLEKPVNPEELVSAVNLALSINERAQEQRLEQEVLQSKLALLTERETQVLKAVAQGLYNKVIADELGLSVSMVETHRRKIMQKLRAESLYDLVRIADTIARPDH